MSAYHLEVPLPDIVSAISQKHKQYMNDSWQMFSIRHKPENNLYSHLVVALKYEGVNLGVLNALFKSVSQKELEIIHLEPLGTYSRRIWFLYEWLTGNQV
jgi:hypothetical protein